MALQIAGQTTHFIVRYDDAVGAPALAVANSVLRQCEADLLRLSFYLPFRLGGAGDPFTHPPIDIQIVNDPLGGPGFSSADNNGHFPGHQSRIRINPFSAPGVTISDDFAGFAFVAEMAEVIMVSYAWDAGSSVPTGAVTAKQSLTLRTRTVEYGGSYEADQERCEKAFERTIAGRVRVQESLNLLFTLPDPPPPGYLTKVLEAVAHIQEELARLAATDHATATKIARYAAIQVGVPAHVFLKDATIT
jgi:hypothetical protein